MIDAAKIEELRGLLEQAIGGLEEGCLPCASCGHDEPTGDMDVLYELRAMQRILTLDLAASLAREGEDGELCKRLEIKADMIQLGEKIAYGSDSEIMREASARIRALAAENKALRRERDNLAALADLGDEPFGWWSDYRKQFTRERATVNEWHSEVREFVLPLYGGLQAAHLANRIMRHTHPQDAKLIDQLRQCGQEEAANRFEESRRTGDFLHTQSERLADDCLKLRACAETSESLVAELREKVERLTKALLRLQTGAAVALDALPEDQREGVVGNFLAAIHRECCAGLCASKGADECKEATP